MKTAWGWTIGLLLVVLTAAAGVCQERFEIQKPEGVADLEYEVIAPGKLLISASDEGGNPVRGLTARDFVLLRNGREGRILGVETLETSQDVSLNIVLVVDNSASMKQRRAVASILSAMENIYRVMRPIDNVTAIVFNDKETRTLDGRPLHVTVEETNRPEDLRAFLENSFDKGLTAKTVLYEGMLAGLAQIRRMPADSHKFMVVFTDGEDINSAYKSADVAKAAENLTRLEVYAIDYMPGSDINPFLQSFSQRHGGRTWKAATTADLGPIFEAVSFKLLHRYVVDYQFLFPPTGSFALGFDDLRIEEITTIDSSPLLNYLYFEEGQSTIPGRYVRFQNQGAAEAFSEQALRAAMEKYANLLNIIGRRLLAHPEATIRLVGCNADIGEEKGNKALSRARAEAVKAYLQYIWGIDPGRMEVETRNLPAVPTSGRTPEGHQENRRVEIHSADPAILDVVLSTYSEYTSNVETLSVSPLIASEHGVGRWAVSILGDGKPLFATSGNGMPDGSIALRDPALNPVALSAYRQLTAELVVEDVEGQSLKLAAGPVPVTFIQRETQKALNLGYRVQERYALILFDFDSDVIKERNAAVVDTIVSRIRRFPEAKVSIVGHTDNIGKEDYNLRLSERRARAVYDQIAAALAEVPGTTVTHMGMGSFDSLYSNGLPENRALNRTVTVTLEYEQTDH